MNPGAGITSIHYINLDRATSRRATIEENLAKFVGPGVAIRRIRAVDEGYVTRHKIAGSTTHREKACFLSHRRAIERSLDTPGYTLILEDDAQLGSRTMPVLNMLLPAASGKFDVIFTDLSVTSVQSMLSLFKFRREQTRNQCAGIFHTRKLDNFFGAAAYVLDDRSKRKLLSLLKQVHLINLPYDQFLAAGTRAEALTSGYCFPFLTTQSPHASNSQIQPDDYQLCNMAWNDFRRLMFLEADTTQAGKLPLDVNQISEDFCGREASCFTSILKVILSDKLPELGLY